MTITFKPAKEDAKIIECPPGWLTLREALAILEARQAAAPAMDGIRAALEKLGATK